MSDGVLMLGVVVIILMFGAPKVVTWAKSLGEAKQAFEEASKGKTSTTKTVEVVKSEVVEA